MLDFPEWLRLFGLRTEEGFLLSVPVTFDSSVFQSAGQQWLFLTVCGPAFTALITILWSSRNHQVNKEAGSLHRLIDQINLPKYLNTCPNLWVYFIPICDTVNHKLRSVQWKLAFTFHCTSQHYIECTADEAQKFAFFREGGYTNYYYFFFLVFISFVCRLLNLRQGSGTISCEQIWIFVDCMG